MLKPKNTKYKKSHKGRMDYTQKKKEFSYGEYAIISKESANLTSNQITTAELAIKRSIKKEGIVYKRVFPHVPVTRKPAEVRMGKGKGSVDHYIARVSPGSFIFELKTSNKFIAKAALRTAASKLPFQSIIVSRPIPLAPMGPNKAIQGGQDLA
jgi:large subunit ribosomal protein L16